MHLTTLVGILERDQSDTPIASVREKLAQLYSERGHHREAMQQRRIARDTSPPPPGGS